MPLLYDVAIGLYHAGVRCAALFGNVKAKQWVAGRQGLWERLNARRQELNGCLWIHCASVGEFEQGRPVLETIKARRPELPVLLTFFSPSGYEARKDYALATHVDYLPPDNAPNGQRIVELLKPSMALFVKYEFWYHHLHALKVAAVPTYLVSAVFRSGQPFFAWYGAAWRSMLQCYTHVFTQDDRSRELLVSVGLKDVSVSGDTRFDRVAAIVSADEELSVAERFSKNLSAPMLVCGSTWPADEVLLLAAFDRSAVKSRILIAPHEPTTDHLTNIEARFPRPVFRWSALENGSYAAGTTCLVDRMGLLARLYKYADVVYVGGGFGDGIHSLLEAAAWGKPVIFGPNHRKFVEAQGLIDAGAGFEVKNADELRNVLDRLLGDHVLRALAGEAAARYVRERLGATTRVVEHVLPAR
jgi:3-deoxy-D-manno-octulosonic-acid transferase